jgi:hypothetical protein
VAQCPCWCQKIPEKGHLWGKFDAAQVHVARQITEVRST